MISGGSSDTEDLSNDAENAYRDFLLLGKLKIRHFNLNQIHSYFCQKRLCKMRRLYLNLNLTALISVCKKITVEN